MRKRMPALLLCLCLAFALLPGTAAAAGGAVYEGLKQSPFACTREQIVTFLHRAYKNK